MKALPVQLLDALEGIPGFDNPGFLAAHDENKKITSIRLHPAKCHPEELPFVVNEAVPWSSQAYYLEQRPSFTFDPFFHAGWYYVQEASSMFLEQVFLQLQLTESRLRVLDLCASPGGKSTHIQSLIHPESLLVSNEVIRNRALVLRDNLLKWGGSNVLATSNDPSAFRKFPAFFDVMVVDAPCSGSGLFRKEEDAIDEWSPANVALCSQRQQRILSDTLPSLKEEGILVYCTCSYSKEEDEYIADWLVGEMNMESIPLNLLPEWNIVETISAEHKAYGYRFFPHRLKGEGFYLACFRNRSSSNSGKISPIKLTRATGKEKEILLPWLAANELEIIRENDRFFCLSEAVLKDYELLKKGLYFLNAGVEAGQIMKNRLVPAHALAMSSLLHPDIPSIETNYENAILYLQRADLKMESGNKGWHLVKYKSASLGWVNMLQNRMNNYYPKELRILKQVNDSAFEK